MIGRVMIRDHRGRRVEMMRVSWYGRKNREVVQAAQDSLIGQPWSRRKLKNWLAAIVVGGGAPLVATLAASWLRPIIGVDWAFAVTLVVMLAWFATAGQWIWRRTSAEPLSAELVRRGCCASCGYNLWDLVPEPDGCRVCPECGGAWRVER
ncbi:MAG TPA: hypothetical protein VD997_07050 [Phycisphaerales bacterium]|nr:hypothetical protein [Phycisphaerales bacterium]